MNRPAPRFTVGQLVTSHIVRAPAIVRRVYWRERFPGCSGDFSGWRVSIDGHDGPEISFGSAVRAIPQ